MFVLLSRTQAGPGRTVKQEQEEISRNHVQTFISPSVYAWNVLKLFSPEIDSRAKKFFKLVFPTSVSRSPRAESTLTSTVHTCAALTPTQGHLPFLLLPRSIDLEAERQQCLARRHNFPLSHHVCDTTTLADDGGKSTINMCICSLPRLQ